MSVTLMNWHGCRRQQLSGSFQPYLAGLSHQLIIIINNDDNNNNNNDNNDNDDDDNAFQLMMAHNPTETDLWLVPKSAVQADGGDIASWTFAVAR